MTRHIEDDTPCNDGGHFFDTEFGETGNGCKIMGVVAVVIHGFVTEMAKTVDLAADAKPALKNVVVVGHSCIWSRTFLLQWLYNL